MSEPDGTLGPEVETAPFPPASGALLVVQARQSLDVVDWAARSRAFIERRLLTWGALLFRGFGLDSTERARTFAAAISDEFPPFPEESSPRSRLDGPVYTSTDYPAAYPIQFHNEHSYASEWPMKLYFACLTPASRGGETPLASSRRILRRLSPSTQSAFRARGIMYARTFTPGAGLTWQVALKTDDRATAEAYCAQRSIDWAWLPGDRLRTRQVRAAIVRHPLTGDEVWFNHGWFFNLEALRPVELRDYLRTQPEDSLPNQTYFGDGTPIPKEILQELEAVYASEGFAFPWARGDLLVIDNMLTAHARSPYTGSRKVVVLMADRCRRSDLRPFTAASRSDRFP